MVRRLHQIAGFILAVPLLLIAVSGSVLVFEREVDALIEPHYREVEVGGALMLESAVNDAAVSRAATPLALVRTGPEAGDVYRLVLRTADGETPSLLIDPYSARSLGEERPSRATALMRELHLTLMAGASGETARNLLGLALLPLVAAGLYLWWPGRKRVRRSLRFGRAGPPLRRIRELHTSIGVIASLLIGVAALSGTILAYPETAAAIIDPLSRVDRVAAGFQPHSTPQGTPLSAGRLIQASAVAAPAGAHLSLLVLPGEASTAARAVYRRTGSGEVVAVAFIDPATALPLEKMMMHEASIGTRLFVDWALAAHGGAIGGPAGRLAAAATGLGLTLLVVTGFLHWIARRRRRKQ